MRHRVNLLDMWVDNIDLAAAGAQVDAFIRARTPHQIIPANVDFLRLGSSNPHFRDLINSADMVLPDGMPLVWATRLLGDPLPRRISGIDMMHETCRVAAREGYRVFLLGAQPGVAAATADLLQRQHPGLCIAGTYAPPPLPLSQAEEEYTLRMIQECAPDILFVAFGAPLQEYWVRKHLRALGVPVCMGVGGAFDMLAGQVKRAPVWMQDHGLEWLCRLVQEPGRLWKRYLVDDLPVFMRLMAQGQTKSSTTRPVTGLIATDSTDIARTERVEVHPAPETIHVA